MTNSMQDRLTEEIERVGQIPIIKSILEVVCQSTGMGFAAIAKVTETRWIAYSVLDKISFGLLPGGELKIETTICNEVRTQLQEVVIDNVDEDPAFCDHHTPKMYGFKSYISCPIFLKNGDFFGTLCAIDPKPAQVKNEKIVGMFRIFADLISFHFQGLEIIGRNKFLLKDTQRQLADSKEEISNYHHISNHDLQEPLRKIRIFSDLLIHEISSSASDKAKELAEKMAKHAQRASSMITDIAYFSELERMSPDFTELDLMETIRYASEQLGEEISSSGATVDVQALPKMKGKAYQLQQLFYYLIQSSLALSEKNSRPVLSVAMGEQEIFENGDENFFEIVLSNSAAHVDPARVEKMFTSISFSSSAGNTEINLAYCRKIVLNHGGKISASSPADGGLTFSMFFPHRLLPPTEGL